MVKFQIVYLLNLYKECNREEKESEELMILWIYDIRFNRKI